MIEMVESIPLHLQNIHVFPDNKKFKVMDQDRAFFLYLIFLRFWFHTTDDLFISYHLILFTALQAYHTAINWKREEVAEEGFFGKYILVNLPYHESMAKQVWTLPYQQLYASFFNDFV